jgi:hypothetical protein
MCSHLCNLYQETLGQVTGTGAEHTDTPAFRSNRVCNLSPLPCFLRMIRLATEEGVQQLLAGWPSRIV